jgi:hypothetical protein
MFVSEWLDFDPCCNTELLLTVGRATLQQAGIPVQCHALLLAVPGLAAETITDYDHSMRFTENSCQPLMGHHLI